MSYLILATLCSASMAIGLRLSEKYSENQYGILVGNYIVCIALSFFSLPEQNLFPEGASVAAGAGITNGIIFISTMLLMQMNIKRNGAVLASTFSKLGILIPVCFSVFLFGEKPTFVQMIGIILVAAAILMINREKESGNAEFKAGLLFLTVSSGMADGMSKVFEQIGERQYDRLFLLYTFCTAFLLSLFPLFKSRQRITWMDLLGGLMVGIPNYFSTWLLLASVTRLPAYFVYPSFSVGTILVVSFVSVLLLKDRLTRRQIYGCGLILCALVFLNL